MKKKIMALSTVFSVLASLLPANTAVLAQSNDLFTEDFESYEVGTIIEATSDQTSPTRVGNIDYQLRAGDKLEIAQENGNKYLKITRASESSTNSHIKYYFHQTYSGKKYSVSYDFRPDVHNRYFARFGSLMRTSGINLTTVSYGNNVYANSSTTNSVYYVPNLLKSANYTGSQYATITQTVDLTSDSDNYEFNAVYPNSSGGTAEKTVTNTANQLGITGLAWAIQKNTNNNFNGPDDAATAAVYRIDNIVVKAVLSLGIVSTNVQNNGTIYGSNPFTMTFNEEVSAAAVTLEANGAAMAASDYTVTVSGATVSVVPTAGWKDGVQYKVNVGSVTAVSGSTENINAAFDLEGSGFLFTDNFEGYEVGTIIEAASDQTSATRVGNIEYQLRAGDKLEIAEEDGNKYLKITRASESSTNSHIKYYFPETYSGKKYSVSYDFKPEVHNRYFARFGSFIREGGGINLTTVSYGNNVYAHNGTVADYYVANLIKTTNYTGSAYATVTQTVDLTSASNNYEFHAVYPGSSGTVEKTVTNTANQLDITGLAWAIQKNTNNNYNGPDDAAVAGVYRIDNIKVKAIAMELASTNVSDNGKISGSTPFEMTFSDAVSTADITLKKNGIAMSGSDYTVTVSDNTVSVVPADGWEEGAVYTVNVGQVTAAGLSPFEGAAFTLVASNSLFEEDFEGYPIGVIASGDINTVSTTRNPGGLVYKLIEGDTLEVVEKDGSKVLKLTAKKGDTTERRLILDFDQHYGDGKPYNVSFDYYVENNSVYFSDFGSVCDDKISGQSAYVHKAYYNPIKVISSYRDNLYFDRVTSENKYYGENLLDADDASWKSQSMMIDFSQDPRPFTIKTTKKSDGSSLAKKSLTVSQTFGKQTADNISSIAWDFQSNSTSSGWDGRDEGSGVYYIDNVKVTPARLELVNSNVTSGQELSVDTDIHLEFNGAVPENVADHITITQNDEPLSDAEYSVSISEDSKTVTVCPANGWDYDSTYTLCINSIESPVFDAFEGAVITFETEEYVNELPPDIVSSTIANGAENVDFRTESVILSTDAVAIDASTITKQNIKLYKDGEAIDSYSVAPQGKFAVKVSFDGLDKDASYTLSVSGLMSQGAVPLSMTNNFVLAFETVGDIYVKDIAITRTEQENVFDVSATLYNNTENAQSYQPIIIMLDKSDGGLTGLKMGESGVLAANSSTEISVSGINADLDQIDCELLIWDNIENLTPLTSKQAVKKMRTGTTVIFANNSNVVVADGESFEEETSVQKVGGEFVVPAELASKYLGINNSLTEDDITDMGIGSYVSDEYDFIAVGDNVSFNAASEEEAIKKFGIYVSPDGDDNNAGYCSAPVKTLARAVKIYEKDNKQPIRVHSGTYRLSETLILKSSKDNGMTIKDFGDGEVIISGAVELPSSAFTTVTDSSVKAKIPSAAQSYVKQISLSDYVDGDMSAYREYTTQQVSDAYYELFSGDEAQTIARWPNTGFSTISGLSGKSFTPASGKASLWKSADSGIIAGYFKYNWAFEDIYIDKDSSTSTKIVLGKTPKYGIENGQRFYAMNMLEELDTPGEYYIDNNAKILYYYPTSSFSSVNPELSVMDKSVLPDYDNPKNYMMYLSRVNDITISGITFEKTRGSGIVTNGGTNISIDGCVFRNIGNTAVSLNSTKDSEVVNSHLYSLGGRGIYADAGSINSLTPGNIRIADNTIHNFGRVFRTYQGAIHLHGCGNVAEYNTIYDAPHCAIRFNGSNHKISHNIIHDVVKETSDAGAIYAGRDWTSWGTTITKNYMYNIKNNVGDSYTNQAVYIDDLMCGATVSYNVIKDSDCAALFGGGRGNNFKYNTVVNCNIGLKYDNRGETYSAGQLVRGQLSDGTDTILEAFVKFLAKDSVIATMEERNKTTAFQKLVEDVNDSSNKLGYPKHATITNNNFYGSKVNNTGYLDMDTHVTNYALAYRDNNSSTSVPSYDLPDCGVRN